MTLTKEQLLAISLDPKAFLERAYRIQEKIEARLERISMLRSNLESTTATIKENTSSSTGDSNKLESGVLNIMELEEEIAGLQAIPKEIRTALNTLLKNADLYLLLELRYLNQNTWDEIALKMNYTTRWVLTLHTRALEELQEESTKVHPSGVYIHS